MERDEGKEIVLPKGPIQWEFWCPVYNKEGNRKLRKLTTQEQRQVELEIAVRDIWRSVRNSKYYLNISNKVYLNSFSSDVSYIIKNVIKTHVAFARNTYLLISKLNLNVAERSDEICSYYIVAWYRYVQQVRLLESVILEIDKNNGALIARNFDKFKNSSSKADSIINDYDFSKIDIHLEINSTLNLKK